MKLIENLIILYWIGVIVSAIVSTYQIVNGIDKFKSNLEESLGHYNKSLITVILVVAFVLISGASWVGVVSFLDNEDK